LTALNVGAGRAGAAHVRQSAADPSASAGRGGAGHATAVPYHQGQEAERKRENRQRRRLRDLLLLRRTTHGNGAFRVHDETVDADPPRPIDELELRDTGYAEAVRAADTQPLGRLLIVHPTALRRVRVGAGCPRQGSQLQELLNAVGHELVMNE